MKPVCVTMATRASWLSSCARALEDAQSTSGENCGDFYEGGTAEIIARPRSLHGLHQNTCPAKWRWWAQQMPPRSRAMKPPYQHRIELPTSANHDLLGGCCSIDISSKWQLWSPCEDWRLQWTKGRVSIKHHMVPRFWKHAFKTVQLSVSRFHGYRKRFNNNMSSTLLSWKFNFQFNFTLISACIKVNNLEEMERCISPSCSPSSLSPQPTTPTVVCVCFCESVLGWGGMGWVSGGVSLEIPIRNSKTVPVISGRCRWWL